MEIKLKNDLDKLGKYWDQVEERLKDAEVVVGKAVNPAVNELRYAGRVLVDAWHLAVDDQASEEQIQEKISVAKQYLENAKHDITDAICLYHNQKLKLLLERYKKKTLSKKYSNLEELLQKVDQANGIITLSRGDRKKRPELYKDLEENYIPYLLKEYKKLEVAELLAAKNENIQKWKARCAYIVGGVAFILGLIGSIASILGLFGSCGDWVSRIELEDKSPTQAERICGID